MAFLAVFTTASLISGACYLFLLSRRLHGPHPALPQSAQQRPLTPTELDNVVYSHIDPLAFVPRKPTHEGYVVVGGAGFVGQYVQISRCSWLGLLPHYRFIIRLLLLRGETSIRIVDLKHPTDKIILSSLSVSFVHADITSLPALRAALTAPFPATGMSPTVIYHTAAIIRFYERATYAYPPSHAVNVLGTQNVLAAARELPRAIVIYTSTCDVACARAQYLRLGRDYAAPPRRTPVVRDADPPVSDAQAPQSCYTRSKRAAEALVLRAHGRDGLRTGALRPG